MKLPRRTATTPFLALFALLALWGTTSAGAATNGRIYFSSKDYSVSPTHFTIASINPDGTDQQRVTTRIADTDDEEPVVSADGTTLAFTRITRASGSTTNNTAGAVLSEDIYTLRLDGASLPQQVFANPGSNTPAHPGDYRGYDYSPAFCGSRLYFISGRSGTETDINPDVFRQKDDGTLEDISIGYRPDQPGSQYGERSLSCGVGDGDSPLVTNQDTQVSTKDDVFRLHVGTGPSYTTQQLTFESNNPAGGQVLNAWTYQDSTAPAYNTGSAATSPDGSLLAFYGKVAGDANTPGVFVQDLTGPNVFKPRKLDYHLNGTNYPAVVTGLTFSPDGTKLLWSTGSALITYDLATSTPSVIQGTPTINAQRGVAWVAGGLTAPTPPTGDPGTTPTPPTTAQQVATNTVTVPQTVLPIVDGPNAIGGNNTATAHQLLTNAYPITYQTSEPATVTTTVTVPLRVITWTVAAGKVKKPTTLTIATATAKGKGKLTLRLKLTKGGRSLLTKLGKKHAPKSQKVDVTYTVKTAHATKVIKRKLTIKVK